MLYEYIWLDGNKTPQLRSKTMVLNYLCTIKDLPTWKFDGSSTQQAQGKNSDCLLKPVFMCHDPTRKNSYLVLCEVLTSTGETHPSNTRRRAAELENTVSVDEPWCAIEQEYFLMREDTNLPFGFGVDEMGETSDENGNSYTPAQGQYYCSVGGINAFGREIAEKHLRWCLEAGLAITGINAEVAPGQWEIQVGGPFVSPVTMADNLWIARWLLHRATEEHVTLSNARVYASFDPKPVEGDWNGSGCHTNFSTAKTREPGGLTEIVRMCEKLRHHVPEHLAAYGEGIERRLTGKHETCSYKEFRYGSSDRTASIRIPLDVELNGCGYFEDRRPNSNCDPYQVVAVMMQTCCL